VGLGLRVLQFAVHCSEVRVHHEYEERQKGEGSVKLGWRRMVTMDPREIPLDDDDTCRLEHEAYPDDDTCQLHYEVHPSEDTCQLEHEVQPIDDTWHHVVRAWTLTNLRFPGAAFEP